MLRQKQLSAFNASIPLTVRIKSTELWLPQNNNITNDVHMITTEAIPDAIVSRHRGAREGMPLTM